jgi:hypothetical protein
VVLLVAHEGADYFVSVSADHRNHNGIELLSFANSNLDAKQGLYIKTEQNKACRSKYCRAKPLQTQWVCFADLRMALKAHLMNIIFTLIAH